MKGALAKGKLDMVQKFEAAVHNADVRRMISAGDQHRDLSEAWADTHYIEISANTLEEAQEKLNRKYPSDQGYVIESIQPALD